MTTAIRNAAQYLRMSTDSQDLSLGIQEQAIRAYARANRFTVVSTYADEGRSGVHIENRPALRQLLKDVIGGHEFDAVLVFDVSRWGRFQDSDAAAYYDYHCRLHGVQVIYVAETFGTDQTPIAALVKSMKRVMAAEYSRELACKCLAGQQKILSMGFQMGRPPLGYRRLSVSADGSRRVQLEPGQRKLAQTDRIRWVLGPPSEVALVRRIFALYAHTKCSARSLTRRATQEGWTDGTGALVDTSSLGSLLRNEAVIGNFVWGREHRQRAARIVTGSLVRQEHAVPRIIDDDTWALVQARLTGSGAHKRSDEQMLDELRAALQRNPGLTTSDLSGEGCATVSLYKLRFGNFRNAVRAAGGDAAAVARNVFDRARDKRNLSFTWGSSLAQKLCELGLTASFNGRSNRFAIGKVAVRQRLIWQAVRAGGRRMWLARGWEGSEDCDYVLLVRMTDLDRPRDYFLVSPGDLDASFPSWLPAPVPHALRKFWCRTPSELIGHLRQVHAGRARTSRLMVDPRSL